MVQKKCLLNETKKMFIKFSRHAKRRIKLYKIPESVRGW
jgi:hypothetical protein